MMTAALYVRVSTGEQNTDRQLSELREFAARKEWTVVEYEDKQSGAKKRPALTRLMEDARLRRFDIVIVLALDRFGRSSRQLVTDVETLDSYGVRFIALNQAIDTDKKSPIGTLMFQMFSAFAEFERAIIIERVVSGVREAQRKGKHCGRPKKIFRRDEMRALKARGLSLRKIAKELGIPLSTVADALSGRTVRKPSRKQP
jgi:putative DNA-invertase from lambdoid prophage Rac